MPTARVAQTLSCNVCDAGCGVATAFESEVESSHVVSAAFLRPESSSLPDHEHLSARPYFRLGTIQARIHFHARRPAKRVRLPHRRICSNAGALSPPALAHGGRKPNTDHAAA